MRPLSTALILLMASSSAAFLTSCGGDDDSSSETPSSKEGKVGAVDFLLLSDSGLAFSGTTLAGSGSAIAKNPLGEVKDDTNLAVTFTVEEGGSVSMRAFASKTLEDGVALTLSRKGTKLSAALSAGGKSVDISKTFAALDASKEVSVLVDVHNGETPAHVLAWKGGTASPSEQNALFNSEKAGDGESAGNGKGTFWGLVLSKAVVTSAAVSDAKFEHE
ncbi:MAG: hypothetical protein IOD12_15670 [Silvanigrellales bacterium]|nr:hypothetical protein [Silvanigrellales bacterium]